MFIQTRSEEEAEGKLREIYETDRKNLGYVPNHAKVFSDAGLGRDEVAMMEFVQKIIRNANRVTQDDVGALRALDFDDIEILDITLTATMRSFASKTFDTLGAGPDAVYHDLERQLSDLLPE